MIVGGESGAGARPMQKEWVLSLRDQCERARVPFFFKQWGGVHKSKAGRELDGKTYDGLPHRAVACPGEFQAHGGNCRVRQASSTRDGCTRTPFIPRAGGGEP